MYEDRPEKDTPAAITADLTEYGGLNPHGNPVWRLVRAENCRIQCFGTMNHISVDTSKLADFARPTDVPIDRMEEGEFWVPRYKKLKGWILQRWFPPSAWGTREMWESQKARDGRARLLAAYPQRGDYMMVPCGPWHSVEEAHDLKGYIRCWNAQQRNNPINWQNYEEALLAFELQERQQEAEAYAQEIEAQYRLGPQTMLRSVSTAAQKWRNSVADHTAQGVMLGAAEKWG